jgi:DNA modification methylase
LVCGKCGARRIDAQIGLESTPEEYVAKIVEVFRAVRRVLRKDGTLWLNLGDSYAGSGRGPTGANGIQQAEKRQGFTGGDPHGKRSSKTDAPDGFKAKDLIGIPWRVAIALSRPHLKCRDCGNVAHFDKWGRWPNGRMICPSCEKSKGHEIAEPGWYLRSDIIWAKPNPMPESVTDRPTKAHEYLFLLSKSPRYFYDAEAIREQFADERMGNPGGGGNYMRALYPDRPHAQSGLKKGEWTNGEAQGGRNRRTVWTIATEPYPLAHFATFPRKLVQPCILAGCPEHACPKCGAPWVKEVERVSALATSTLTPKQSAMLGNGATNVQYSRGPGWRKNPLPSSTVLGEHPTCTCGLPAIGGTTLDPFGGSGTTAEVALEYGRRAILIELKPEYVELQKRRLAPVAGRPMLNFSPLIEPDEVREFRESLQRERAAARARGDNPDGQ